jgi:hypothetical protein
MFKYFESLEPIMDKNIALCVVVVLVLSVTTTTMMTAMNPSDATVLKKRPGKIAEHLPAVIATSGETVYVVWGSSDPATNTTEVMFRVSGDGGLTYADKVNLSNSTGSNSTDFDVEATDDNVIVSWWESNSTSSEPVLRFSTDNGGTFGPILRLASNGTIGG